VQSESCFDAGYQCAITAILKQGVCREIRIRVLLRCSKNLQHRSKSYMPSTALTSSR
jgi:hypothetical protein